jgi:pimeloyl-ACP methyl ester carboxylesterase
VEHGTEAPGAAAQDAGTVVRPDGRRIAWSATGPADAPPLVWLHGSTGSRRSAPAHPGVRVVAYDRPGFGESTAYPDRTLRSDAEDLATLIAAHGLSAAFVGAFSGGAAAAYAAAALTPGAVRGLTIVSGAAWPVAPPPPAAAVASAARALAADPAAAVAALTVDAPPDDARALADPVVHAGLVRGAADASVGDAGGWVTEALVVRRPWPFAPEDVDTPVRLWHGAHDEAVPLADARATAERLPRATLEVLPHAGHLGWLAHSHALLGTAAGLRS